MTYLDKVNAFASDAEQLEEVYQQAVKAGQTEAFKEAVEDGYTRTPDNLLFAAWFHRLKYAAIKTKGYVVAWRWVLPLAAVNAVIFWLLSDDRFTITIQGFLANTSDFLPVIVLLAAPITTVFVLIFLTAVGRKDWRLGALAGILLLSTGIYVLLVYPQLGTRPYQEQYLILMVLHLPLLAWAGVGGVLIYRHRDPANRFALLYKSLEVFIVGGLFVIAGGLFAAITVGLFDVVNVDLPEAVQRLFIGGGAGMIAIVAVAVIYNPAVPPADQSFEEGLSKLIALLMRLLLPLTLFVLLIYLIFILLNFQAPFENRDVLIVYNGMLFAVIALLVGATPVREGDLSPETARWLRLGIIAVAFLALLVSIYALAAIVYRSSIDRLTPNRLAFIGWNIVNIGLLLLLLIVQIRAKGSQWIQGLYRAFSAGTVAYAVWTLVVILAIPWLFGINEKAVENLPPTVQQFVYEHPDPILLKCRTSPHIYLLEDGEKRWIDTIETFNDRGYVWRDVLSVTCRHLRSIPDGEPIPADAGPPPQP